MFSNYLLLSSFISLLLLLLLFKAYFCSVHSYTYSEYFIFRYYWFRWTFFYAASAKYKISKFIFRGWVKNIIMWAHDHMIIWSSNHFCALYIVSIHYTSFLRIILHFWALYMISAHYTWFLRIIRHFCALYVISAHFL